MTTRFVLASTCILFAAGCSPRPTLDAGALDTGLDTGAADGGPDVRGSDVPIAEDVGIDSPFDAGVVLDTGVDAGLGVSGFIRGGPGPDQFASVAVDDAGHIAVGGLVSAAFDVGCGPDTAPSETGTAFVAIYDGTGACIRSQRLGTDDLFSTVVAVEYATDGSLVVVGSARGEIDLGAGRLAPIGIQDLFVARYDRSGTLLWGRRIGGPGAPVGVGSLAVDDDSIALAGGLSGTVDFGVGPITAGGPSSTFVLVLEPSGNTRWSAAYGGGRQAGGAVALDGAGGLFVAGGFGGTIDLGGGALSSSGPAPDVFVASLAAADGSHRWSRRYGDAGTQLASRLAVTSTGRLIITGIFDGAVDFGGGTLTSTVSYDAFVTTLLAASGDHERSVGWVGPSDQGIGGILVLSDGYVLTGQLDGATDFSGGTMPTSGVGGFIARFDDRGAHVASRFFGTPGRTGVADVAVHGGRFVAVGTADEELDFGEGLVSGLGGQDGYLVFLSL